MFEDVLDCVHIDDTLSLEAGEARRFEHRGVAGLRLCHGSLTVGWSIQKVLLAVRCRATTGGGVSGRLSEVLKLVAEQLAI